MRAGASLVVVEGEPLVRLWADDLELDVAPGLSGLGVALRRGGRDRVALHRGLDGYRAGHTTGVPLLHPWANRLPGDDVAVVDSDVTLHLAGDDRVTRDPNGLPMHGTVHGTAWNIELVETDEDGDGAWLELVLAFDEHPDLLATFPFPHRVRVRWEVLGAGHPDGDDEPLARCTTSVVPTTDAEVPVSFGWHPYLHLPEVPRADWRLRLPGRHHLELDERGLPTGASAPEPAEDEPLGDRTFDDAYALADDRVLGLSAGDASVTIMFDEGYPNAQVYAPASDDVVALEPMTAATAALTTGAHPWAEPGSAFSATFTLTAT